MAAALLAGSLECGVANRLVLIGIAGEPEAGSGKWRCRRLAMVVEVPVESGVFETAIREAAGGAGNVTEGPLTLEGAGGMGLTGRWFQIGGRTEMRYVEVAVGGGWTRVGLGSKGVLKEWLEAGDDGPGATAALQRTVRGQEGGRQVLEAVIDLDRLRGAAPARFSQSQVGGELEALGLANARAFSFGVAAGDASANPVAFSWGSRSEPSEGAIGLPAGGQGVLPAEEGWGWSLGVKATVRAVADRMLGMSRAWRTKFGMMEFDRALERWSQNAKTKGALSVVQMGEVDLRLGVGAEGLFRGRVVLPRAAVDDVVAAIGSLPGAALKEAGKWVVPVLGAADDAAGVLRQVQVSIKPEGDGVVVEAWAVGP